MATLEQRQRRREQERLQESRPAVAQPPPQGPAPDFSSDTVADRQRLREEKRAAKVIPFAIDRSLNETKSPQQLGQDAETSRELGVPIEVVQAVPEQAERDRTTRQMLTELELTGSPLFGTWASREKNMGYFRTPASIRANAAPAKGFERFSNNVALNTEIGFVRATTWRYGLREVFGDRVDGVDESRWLSAEERVRALDYASRVNGEPLGPHAPWALNFLAGVPGAVGEQLPIFATVGGANLVGAVTPVPGAALVGGLGTAFAVETADFYGSSVMENPELRMNPVLRGVSMAVGTINAPMEQFGIGFITKPLKQSVNRAFRRQMNAQITRAGVALSVAGRVPQTALIEAFTEGGQEFTAAFGDEFFESFLNSIHDTLGIESEDFFSAEAGGAVVDVALSLLGRVDETQPLSLPEILEKGFDDAAAHVLDADNIDRMLAASKKGAQGGGGLSSVTTTANAVGELATITAAESEQLALAEIQARLENPEADLKDIDKTALVDLVDESVRAGSPVDTVYVKGKVWNQVLEQEALETGNQGFRPENAAASVGALASWEAAQLPGNEEADIAVPVGEYFARIGSVGELGRKLFDHIRIDPKSPTRSEMRERRVELRDKINLAIEEGKERKFVNAEEQTDFDSIVQGTMRSFEVPGGLRPAEAERVGLMNAAFFTTQARALSGTEPGSVSALDLFGDQQLRVETALTQASAGSTSRADALVLESPGVKQAALRLPDGQILTGLSHGEAFMGVDETLEEAIEAGAEIEEGFTVENAEGVTEFKTRDETFDLFGLDESAQIARQQQRQRESGTELEQPADEEPGAPARGGFRPSRDTQGAMIRMGQASDLSTVLHESWHWYMDQMEVWSAQEGAPEQIRNDWQQLLDWGTTEDELWTAKRAEVQRAAERQLANGDIVVMPSDAELRRAAMHEKLATAGEQYLFEGKAPTRELQGAFTRFREWLAEVYRNWEQIHGGTPPQEVRDVFDRLFASQHEIDAAAAGTEFRPVFTSAEEAGMTPEQFADYLDAHREVRATAVDRRLSRKLDSVKRRLAKEFRAERKSLFPIVERRLRENPIMIAREWLRTGTWIAPFEMPAEIEAMGRLRLERTTLEEAFDPAVIDQLPKQVIGGRSATNVVAYDTFADLFGAQLPGELDGHSLIMGMRNLGTLKQETERNVDAIMEDRHPSEERGDEAAREAIAEIESDQHGTVLADELRQLSGLALREPARVGARRVVGREGPERPQDALQRIRDADLVVQAAQQQLQGSEPQDRGQAEEELNRAVVQLQVARARSEASAEARRAQNAALGRVRSLTVDVRAVRDAARELVANTRLEQLRPQSMLAEERRGAEASRRAVAAGDFEAARDAKRSQLFAHYSFQATLAARARAELIVRQSQRFTGNAVRAVIGRTDEALDLDILPQLDSLLDRFVLRRAVSLKRVLTARGVRDLINDVQGMGYTVPLNPDIESKLQLADRTHWRELTLTQLEGLHDTVQSLAHIARQGQKLDKEAKQVKLDDAASEIVTHSQRVNRRDASALQGDDTIGAKARSKALDVNAFLTKMEHYFRRLDGGAAGPIHRFMFQPFVVAEGDRYDRMADYQLRLERVFKRHYTRVERLQLRLGRRHIDSLGRAMSWEGRIAVALNNGNDDNLLKLKEGEQNRSKPKVASKVTSQLEYPAWDDEDVRQVRGTLDARDWAFVHDVWSLIDTLWPEVAALERRVNGLSPLKVEARAFEQVTSDGETITVKGGYYPIAYDTRRHERATRFEDAKAAQEMFGAAGGATHMTRQGHTVARKVSVGLPMVLDLRVVSQHINDVILDLTHREALVQVSKLTRDKRVAQEMKRAGGLEMFSRIDPWLQAIATEDRTPSTDIFTNFLGYVRSGVTISAMGLKATTTVTQFLGLLTSLDELAKGGDNGYSHFYHGMRQYFYRYGEPPVMASRQQKLRDFMYESSSAMRHRRRVFDRDVRSTLRRTGLSGLTTPVKNSYFMFIGMADEVVSTITWLGAYEQAMDGDVANIDIDSNTLTRDAIAYADSMVRTSQGAGGTKDLAEVQRGTEFRRNFTMFYSYFSVLYSLTGDRLRMSRGDIARNTPAAAASYMLLYFIPAILGELIVLRGPDDDEEWIKWAREQQLMYLAQPVPGLRDIVNATTRGTPYEGSPVFRGVGAIPRVAEQASQGELDRAFWSATADAVGAFGHVPARQGMITLEGVYRLQSGGDFQMRDLAFPIPRSRRER